MAVEQWSDHISLHIASEMKKNRRFLACVVSLLLLFCIDLTVCLVSPGGRHKIDANGFVSPWDKSKAPPPYLHRSQVRIIQRHPVKAQPKVASVSSEQNSGDMSNSWSSTKPSSHRRWRSKKARNRMIAKVPIKRPTALVQTQENLDADTGTVR